MILKLLPSGLLFLFASSYVYAGNIISDVPEEPGASEKYIFYLHGSAEESDGENEKYQAAVDAIAEANATVITKIRGDTDPNVYAAELQKQINHLLNKGVTAKNITVTGFSKGAIISLAVAGMMNNAKINYILLAGCSAELNEKYTIDTSNLSGRILSLYDSDDDKFGSCEEIIRPSSKIVYEETDLESGKGHKLFRIPKEKFISQWRDPLIEWVNN